MKQCLTVLSKLQPLTINAWDSACHEDLRTRGSACLGHDMNSALYNCIANGYVTEHNNKYSLTEDLEIIFKKLDII